MYAVYSVKIGHTNQSMLQLKRPMNERGVGILPQLIARIIRNTTQYLCGQNLHSSGSNLAVHILTIRIYMVDDKLNGLYMPIYFMVTLDFQISLFLPQHLSGLIWSVTIPVVRSCTEASYATFLPCLTAVYV